MGHLSWTSGSLKLDVGVTKVGREKGVTKVGHQIGVTPMSKFSERGSHICSKPRSDQNTRIAGKFGSRYRIISSLTNQNTRIAGKFGSRYRIFSSLTNQNTLVVFCWESYE